MWQVKLLNNLRNRFIQMLYSIPLLSPTGTDWDLIITITFIWTPDGLAGDASKKL